MPKSMSIVHLLRIMYNASGVHLSVIVNSIHIYTCFGRCGKLRSNDRLGSAIEIPIAKTIGIFFQPHLRDWINTGSVRKPNLPQCITNYWFYYRQLLGTWL